MTLSELIQQILSKYEADGLNFEPKVETIFYDELTKAVEEAPVYDIYGFCKTASLSIENNMDIRAEIPNLYRIVSGQSSSHTLIMKTNEEVHQANKNVRYFPDTFDVYGSVFGSTLRLAPTSHQGTFKIDYIEIPESIPADTEDLSTLFSRPFLTKLTQRVEILTERLINKIED